MTDDDMQYEPAKAESILRRNITNGDRHGCCCVCLLCFKQRLTHIYTLSSTRSLLRISNGFTYPERLKRGKRMEKLLNCLFQTHLTNLSGIHVRCLLVCLLACSSSVYYTLLGLSCSFVLQHKHQYNYRHHSQ